MIYIDRKTQLPWVLVTTEDGFYVMDDYGVCVEVDLCEDGEVALRRDNGKALVLENGIYDTNC